MTLGALVALALDGAIAVLTAEDLEPLGLHWMPTLAGDRQMVLADGKVLFQGAGSRDTNTAPGGVAYRCWFRATEAAYFIERMIEVLAIELGTGAAELRARNFIRKEQFPYRSALGWDYDSGDYHTAWDKALAAVGYKAAARAGQAAGGLPARRDPQADGHRPQLLHRDRWRRAGQELRHPRDGDVRQLRDPHPSHRVGHRAARHDQPGPGPRDHVRSDPRLGDRHPIEEGDTDTAPYGLGT